MGKLLNDEEIGQLEWGSPTLDMSFTDDYPKETEVLLKAQLDKDEKRFDKEREQIRQDERGEIRQFIVDYHILLPKDFDRKYNVHSHPDCNILRVFDEWPSGFARAFYEANK